MTGKMAAKKSEKNAFPEPDHPGDGSRKPFGRLCLAAIIRLSISVINWQIISCPDQVLPPLFPSLVYVKGYILG